MLVPDCACAMTWWTRSAGAMARCWMAEGCSKPQAHTPRSSKSRRPMFSERLITSTAASASRRMLACTSLRAQTPSWDARAARRRTPQPARRCCRSRPPAVRLRRLWPGGGGGEAGQWSLPGGGIRSTAAQPELCPAAQVCPVAKTEGLKLDGQKNGAASPPPIKCHYLPCHSRRPWLTKIYLLAHECPVGRAAGAAQARQPALLMAACLSHVCAHAARCGRHPVTIYKRLSTIPFMLMNSPTHDHQALAPRQQALRFVRKGQG